MMRSTWEPVTKLSPAQKRTRRHLITGTAVIVFVTILAAIAMVGLAMNP